MVWSHYSSWRKTNQAGWFVCAPATIIPSPCVQPEIIDSHASCRQEQRPQEYEAGLSHGWEQSLQEVSMAGAPTSHHHRSEMTGTAGWLALAAGLLWVISDCLWLQHIRDDFPQGAWLDESPLSFISFPLEKTEYSPYSTVMRMTQENIYCTWGGDNGILFLFLFDHTGTSEILRHCLATGELIYNFVYWLKWSFKIIKIFNCFSFTELISLIYIKHFLVKNRWNCTPSNWFLGFCVSCLYYLWAMTSWLNIGLFPYFYFSSLCCSTFAFYSGEEESMLFINHTHSIRWLDSSRAKLFWKLKLMLLFYRLYISVELQID